MVEFENWESILDFIKLVINNALEQYKHMIQNQINKKNVSNKLSITQSKFFGSQSRLLNKTSTQNLLIEKEKNNSDDNVNNVNNNFNNSNHTLPETSNKEVSSIVNIDDIDQDIDTADADTDSIFTLTNSSFEEILDDENSEINEINEINNKNDFKVVDQISNDRNEGCKNMINADNEIENSLSMDQSSSSLSDSIVSEITEDIINDKKIVILGIPKGLSKPYSTVDNKYYIRVGTTKRIASREELLRLFEGNGSLHFDISPVINTSIKDLNLDVIRDYYLKYNAFDLYDEEKEQVERLLINADILKELNGEKVCSVGGLLIFGKMPQRYLPQNGITFAHFNGSEISDELIDKKVIEGRIQDIAENTLTIIKNNILAPSVINEYIVCSTLNSLTGFFLQYLFSI